MRKYKHLFFDLDRTLWDFDQNANVALQEVYDRYALSQVFHDSKEFINYYHSHNERLWDLYREGKIKKELLRSKRFELTLKEKEVFDPDLSEKIGEEYLEISIQQTKLFPNTYEILEYLKSDYKLYILTNGFKETQFRKLANCRLDNYFSLVFTSETIGYNKPHAKIFHWAVSSVNARKNDCLMIGDDQLVDIKGASNFGIDNVFFNPTKEEIIIPPTFEIQDLIELKSLL